MKNDGPSRALSDTTSKTLADRIPVRHVIDLQGQGAETGRGVEASGDDVQLFGFRQNQNFGAGRPASEIWLGDGGDAFIST